LRLFTGFSISLCIIFSIYSQTSNNWLRVSTPIGATLHRCIFIDTLHGWAGGDSGVIIHTTNGGNTWGLQYFNADLQITDLQFINQNTGYGIANSISTSITSMLSTTNSGINWTATRFFDSTVSLACVYFMNNLTGYVAGFVGSFYKTTNGGTSWAKCNTIQNGYALYPVLRLTFYNSQFGLGCGGRFDFAGVIWSTTDGGLNWSVKDTTAEPQFDIKFYNYPKALACGGDLEFGGTVARSTNAGATWKDSTIGFFGTGMALAFRSVSEFWIPMGFAGTWMHSTDSAKSWSVVPGPDSSGLYDAIFVDADHGWACGQYGSIYKFVSLIGIKKIQTNIPVNYYLYQNYPNPFNPATKIKFSLPSNAKNETYDVKLIVYDVIGNEVLTLVNDKLEPGTYETQWNASGISSGIYFYRVTVTGDAGDFTSTKKMVLLK